MGIEGAFEYQSIHIYTVLVVAVVCLVVFAIGCSKGIARKYKQQLLTGIAIFQLAFEIFWRIIYITVKADTLLSWWPAYPCNVGGILLPIIALCNWERGKKMFYLFDLCDPGWNFLPGCNVFSNPQKCVAAYRLAADPDAGVWYGEIPSHAEAYALGDCGHADPSA